MEFPVDVLAAVSHEELERSAHSYMSQLLYSDPEHGQYFTLTTGRKVRVSLSNVGFVPLYGANLKHKVLALFAPEDQFTAVALFLDDRWYAVDDILRTADPAREGLIKVRSVGDRIVLYALNRIVYRTNEMSPGEVPFLCHGENDYAKILWKSGEAVGFYSVKPRGSLCSSFVSQCYALPVMDSIFVRKSHRGNEHGLQMLEDFVDSFKDDELGLKYPLSPAMCQVCGHYLKRYPADVDLLWEVEGVGGPYQKTRVASKLGARTFRGGLLSWGKDDSKNGQTVEDKVERTEKTSLEITEEIIVVNKHRKVAEETQDTPVSTRTRSSGQRKKRMREEKETSAAESQPEKISRLEEPEAEAELAEVADGDQVAPEGPTEEQEPEEQEMNGKLAEEQGVELTKEDEKDEEKASEDVKDVLQNGEAGEEEEEEEEEEEMDVDEAFQKEDPIDTVDFLEGATTEEQTEASEVAPGADEHHEAAPVAEEKEVAEEKLAEEVPQASSAEEKEEQDQDPSEEEALKAEEKLGDAPEAEEKLGDAPEVEAKLEAAPEAKKNLGDTPEAEEKLADALEAEKELGDVPEAEEKVEAASVVEEKVEAAPEAEENLGDVPEAEEKLADAPEAEENLGDAPEADENLDVPEAEEKLGDAPEVEENEKEVAVDPELAPTEEPLEEATAAPSEEQQGKEESMETEGKPPKEENLSDAEKGDENMDSLELEEEEEEQEVPNQVQEGGEENMATLPEDEKMRGEGEGRSSDESSAPEVRVLRGGRTKAVPPTPKRSSKRLTRKEDKTSTEEERMTIEEERMTIEEETVPEEEKATTEEEEEAEHSSEGEEPPVIDRRVLRRKIKEIQSTAPPRSKRRSKI